MINTFRYGGHKPFVDDEAIHSMELPPSDILEMKGPFLQVTITHPRIIQEDLRRKGQKVPSRQINALIDSGAITSLAGIF